MSEEKDQRPVPAAQPPVAEPEPVHVPHPFVSLCDPTCKSTNCEAKFFRELRDNITSSSMLALCFAMLAFFFCLHVGTVRYRSAQYSVWDAQASDFSRSHFLPGELRTLCYADDSYDFNRDRRDPCWQLVNALYCHSLPVDEPEVQSICNGNSVNEKCSLTHESFERVSQWKAAVEMCAPSGRGYSTPEDRGTLQAHHRSVAWKTVHKLLEKRAKLPAVARVVGELGIERTAWEQISQDSDSDGHGAAATTPQPDGRLDEALLRLETAEWNLAQLGRQQLDLAETTWHEVDLIAAELRRLGQRIEATRDDLGLDLPDEKPQPERRAGVVHTDADGNIQLIDTNHEHRPPIPAVIKFDETITLEQLWSGNVPEHVRQKKPAEKLRDVREAVDDNHNWLLDADQQRRQPIPAVAHSDDIIHPGHVWPGNAPIPAAQEDKRLDTRLLVNDRQRLSRADIERMVQEAEERAEIERLVREIEQLNRLGIVVDNVRV